MFFTGFLVGLWVAVLPSWALWWLYCQLFTVQAKPGFNKYRPEHVYTPVPRFQFTDNCLRYNYHPEFGDDSLFWQIGFWWPRAPGYRLWSFHWNDWFDGYHSTVSIGPLYFYRFS